MSIRRFTVCAVASLSLGLSSCAVQSVPESRTSLSEAPSVRDSVPVKTPPTAPPLGCSLPKEVMLTCGAYRSVGASGIMEWAAEHPVTLRVDQVPGSVLVSLMTPCNPISAPAAISSETIAIDSSGLAVGAKACDGPKNGMESAALSFMRPPVKYT